MVGMTGMFLILGIARASTKSTEYEKFAEDIANISKSEIESDRKSDDFVDEKTWSGYWYKLALNTGQVPKSAEHPGRLPIILALVSFAIGFLVWPRELLGGLIFAVGAVILLGAYFKNLATKRTKTLEKQLPLLISGLRANLQANQTPQSALIAVAKEIPAPLGDELALMSAEIEVNVPVDVALDRLAKRVPSRDIQFLVSAIKIAMSSGSDLEPQLLIIQNIVDNRTRLQQKLASAVASVSPTIWVSAIIIPAMFVFQYFSSPANKDFWSTLVGIVCLIIVSFLYVIGLFISKKLVAGVEKA